MQDTNPFISLRKYQPDISDPKENQATEALAACLKFSSAIKEAFLTFLFGPELPPLQRGGVAKSLSPHK